MQVSLLLMQSSCFGETSCKGKYITCLLQQEEHHNLYNLTSRELKELLVKANCTFLNRSTVGYIFSVILLFVPFGIIICRYISQS